MRALRYHTHGKPPSVMDVAVPAPGPGQVLLRITAAGVCHSDLHIMHMPAEAAAGRLPLTLGHEAAGVVEALGTGVDNVTLGEAVLVYGPWGCGRCPSCAVGRENFCRQPGFPRPPGIQVDGAMAEYLVVPSPRHLVPLGGLDPIEAVALTDAGLTSYSAILDASKHYWPGSTVLVLGVGGLGHLAIQMMKVMAPGTKIIAADNREDKVELARQIGADHALLSGPDAEAEIMDLTSGVGADLVLDMVRVQATVELGRKTVAKEGLTSLVGAGPGILQVGIGLAAMGASVRRPFWGSISELWQLVALAQSGQIHTEIETHALEDGGKVYERLEAGDVRGRAVLIPDRLPAA